MERFELNHNQIIGLLTYSIGIIVNEINGHPVGLMIIILGLLVFFMSSTFGIGLIISLLVILVGFLFKIIHFIYGNEILLLGMLGVLGSLFFKYIYKNYKLDLILIFSAITILFLGVYFKLLHLKYDTELIFIGCIAIATSYGFRFLKKTHKSFEDYNKMALVCFWSVSYLFNVLHWKGAYVFSTLFTLTLWTWLITSMIRDLKSK